MKFLELILTPPAINFIILLIGLALWQYRRASFILILFSTMTLYLSSITLISGPLLGLLEHYPPLSKQDMATSTIKAVVILGGGRYQKAPEWGKEDRLSDDSMRRLEYGAYLAKKMNIQIILTGGSPQGEVLPEAVLMKQVLEKQYGITNAIAEIHSKNTFENAKFTTVILGKLNIKKVYVVSHASHMRRVISSLNYFKIEGIPAPLGYNTNYYTMIGWQTFIPSTNGLTATRKLIHELLGLLWYKIKYFK